MKTSEWSDDAQHCLRVYVAEHCALCRESLKIVQEIRRKFPHVIVEVINLEADDPDNRDGVFSIPTYVLDGRTLSLGNPGAEVIDRMLIQAPAPDRKEQE